ncbi:TorD/DmsD family molecular chaperone [Roseateles oligotrophus]|uniref:Molecular chaperone TorD family protein n=1 Tax=Roseateles oligotrophus TaxID=1769250 RepID=A0ABT2Y988_9BURK|nr:molecular chaperone TorD family protein [Roseateles oligotrophus]MCV2366843.1 molecular chaperone TorD family protein [Roseateles oligotrophus]
MNSSASVVFQSQDSGEELARAEVYGLLAELFFAPPSQGLFEQLRVAVTQAPRAGAFLEGSWGELVGASRRLELPEIEAEYVALFGGVGKPAVCLFSSWYLAGALNQQPLVELRQALEALGLERPPGVLETEDHIAGLCEVMRYLIAGEDLGVSNLATQQRFFNTYLRVWADGLCEAIGAQMQADFYRALADFARDFFAVEAQGFDLVET